MFSSLYDLHTNWNIDVCEETSYLYIEHFSNLINNLWFQLCYISIVDESVVDWEMSLSNYLLPFISHRPLHTVNLSKILNGGKLSVQYHYKYDYNT